MARIPLLFSCHTSAGDFEFRPGVRADDDDTLSCQFCKLPTAGWQETFHLNDDHRDNKPGNVVSACPLCHMPQHPCRQCADLEGIVIWLPEMSQPLITIQVRQIHLECQAAGISPVLGAHVPAHMSVSALSALQAYRALHDRSVEATYRLGSNSPRILGDVLRSSPDLSPGRRMILLGGLRLLPLGRVFAGREDIYPRILRDWTAQAVAPNPI